MIPLAVAATSAPPPHCEYFASGRCRSCALIEQPVAEQLRDKESRCRELLPTVPEHAWLPSVGGGARDFRNKAKLVVGGRPGAVTLGILGPGGEGVDLRDCLIQEPAIRGVIPSLAAFIERSGLPPYDVPRRRGELKFVHLTASPGGDLMLRFVVRSERALAVLRRGLPELREAIPRAVVVSVNLLPEHKAVLEGEREELLLGSALTMDLGDGAPLHLLPQSFFQTNTAVARALYAQAAEWVARERPASLWDLYCGVGGFALHIAAALEETAGGRGPGPDGAQGRDGSGGEGSSGAGAAAPATRPEVLGVEISEAAVRSARRSARERGIPARFVAADATAFALAADPAALPETVIVNPPRRGIGPELSGWLEASGVRCLVYSSCNPESLARDLAAMPSYGVREARIFDMFPHTRHLELAVLLERERAA
ncbi:methyltransferase domain-containing protein [Leucobacter massiliensis]|uniref:23S rRNA (Uracil(747)-C(5))-methyltransferase n=1 Tax=Leucobacter massiliensis TaxID=1686285 RepID=A0A2S9QMQ6_9MICO|nr:methyltransferase domain-containing protein [Leucobacter massiliensis]PRI10865.1 23S rRNA (uracil(747)-C(5))-methyltransferase [Leucobacter massiliensis]